MRFAPPTLTNVFGSTSRQTQIHTHKQIFGASLRRQQYSSNAEQTIREGGSSKILLTSLLGAGVAGGVAYNSTQNVEAKEKPKVFNSESFVELKDHVVGLPIASCIMVQQPGENGEKITRPYTPISEADAEGHVDFVIKKYNTGKLTPIIHNLKIGDTMEMKGPIPKYNWETDQKANVGMIAGGTGITPMLQIIRRIFNEKSTDKKTKVTLLFANVTEGDILLKAELDSIAKQHPDRFKIVYALSKAPESWKGVKGYINKDVVKQHLPAASKDTMIFVCGPPPMVNSLSGPKASIKDQGELTGILKELGYTDRNVFKF